MRVKLLATAKEDLKTEAEFYEETYSGLGAYFLNTIYTNIDSLSFLQVFT